MNSPNESELKLTQNEKELRSMCNAVLLSRVAQYYHPYFSMSAVTSPNNKFVNKDDPFYEMDAAPSIHEQEHIDHSKNLDIRACKLNSILSLTPSHLRETSRASRPVPKHAPLNFSMSPGGLGFVRIPFESS